MRERAQTVRNEETSEARAARLEQKREHAQTVHNEETSEDRAARLEQLREHARRNQKL